MAALKAAGKLSTTAAVVPTEGAKLDFSMESLDGLQVSATTENELMVRDLEQLGSFMEGINTMRARVQASKEHGGLKAEEAVSMIAAMDIIDSNIGIIEEATKDMAFPSQESFSQEGGQLKATEELDATMESVSVLAATVALSIVAGIIALGAKFYKQHYGLIKTVTKRIAELKEKSASALGEPKEDEVKIGDGTFLFAGDAPYEVKTMTDYVKTATANITKATDAVIALRALVRDADPEKLEELNAEVEKQYDIMFDALRKAFGIPGNSKPVKETKNLVSEASDLLPGGRVVVLGVPAEGSKHVGSFNVQIHKQDKHKTVPALTGEQVQAKVADLEALLEAHTDLVKQGEESVALLAKDKDLKAFTAMVKKLEGKKSATYETAIDNYNNVNELSWMFAAPYQKLVTLVTKVMNGHSNQCQASLKNLVVKEGE